MHQRSKRNKLDVAIVCSHMLRPISIMLSSTILVNEGKKAKGKKKKKMNKATLFDAGL